MKYLYLVFFLLTSFTTVIGQVANIKGNVSAGDGVVAPQATIKVKGTGIGTVALQDGSYELTKVPYGEQVVRVSCVGVGAKEFKIIVDKPNHNYDFEIVKGKDIGIQEVVVEGKTEKRALETSGFAVAVIETKEAALRNLTTNELLDRSVGVRVRQN